jgi:hypothetical protein
MSRPQRLYPEIEQIIEAIEALPRAGKIELCRRLRSEGVGGDDGRIAAIRDGGPFERFAAASRPRAVNVLESAGHILITLKDFNDLCLAAEVKACEREALKDKSTRGSKKNQANSRERNELVHKMRVEGRALEDIYLTLKNDRTDLMKGKPGKRRPENRPKDGLMTLDQVQKSYGKYLEARGLEDPVPNCS